MDAGWWVWDAACLSCRHPRHTTLCSDRLTVQPPIADPRRAALRYPGIGVWWRKFGDRGIRWNSKRWPDVIMAKCLHGLDRSGFWLSCCSLRAGLASSPSRISNACSSMTSGPSIPTPSHDYLPVVRDYRQLGLPRHAHPEWWIDRREPITRRAHQCRCAWLSSALAMAHSVWRRSRFQTRMMQPATTGVAVGGRAG